MRVALKELKKSKKIYALLGLALILMIGGTLAYYSQELIVENRFKTAKYDTEIKEVFNPPDKWAPGVEVEKKVSVENLGTVDVVARASFEELWVRTEDILDVEGNLVEPNGKKGSVLPNQITGESGDVYDAAIKNSSKDYVVNYSPGMDLSSQHGKWIYYNGYYYYMGVISQGQTSPNLMESVTLNPIIDATITGTYSRIYLDDQGNKVTEAFNTYGKYGYDLAHYTLTINAQTVQASKSAVDNLWDKNPVTSYIAEKFTTIDENKA